MANYTQPEPGDKPPEDEKPIDGEESLSGWANYTDPSGAVGVEAGNLVPFFLGTDEEPFEEGRKWLADVLAAQVCGDTMTGWDSSEEYRTKRKQNYQMLTGFLPKKSFPFDGCANAHIPLMFERILRLSANVYAEIFLDRDTIFAVKPTGPDDYEESEILSVHGNWQLRNELTDFLWQQEGGVQEFFASGSVFCHSWYDPVQRRNRHDIMSCDEFVLPYVGKTVMVDLSDVPWKTRLIRKFKNELEVLRDQNDWAQIPAILKVKPAPSDVLETKNRDAGAKAEGLVQPDNAGSAGAYLFFEYHGFIKMPGETRMRAICATVESERKIVTKLYIREEEDWRDRMRFDRQTAELERYQSDSAQHQQNQAVFEQATQMEAQLQSQLQAPHVDPQEAAMLGQALQTEPLEPPVPPTPPSWLTETGAPEPIRRVPIEMFSHGRCINNPAGMLGLSIGTILADLNRLSDESLNRYYDSATLSNVWSAVIDDSVKLTGTTLAVKPGTLLRAQNAGGNLKDKIFELRAGQANPQMLDMVRIADENADSAVAAPGVLSGEPGKSGETFRGIASRREMATKQLSAAGIKYLAFLEQILKNNARLNSLFLPEEEVVQVAGQFQDTRKHTLDENGQPKAELVVNRDLYRRSYNVSFTADVRFTSQAQRISEADEVLAMVTNLPPLQGNPAFVYAAVADALRARSKQDLIPLLGPAPPPPQQPFGTPPPPPPGAMPVGPDGQPLPTGAPPPGMPPGGPPQ